MCLEAFYRKLQNLLLKSEALNFFLSDVSSAHFSMFSRKGETLESLEIVWRCSEKKDERKVLSDKSQQILSN